jgi:hypothetical protein
MVFHAGGLAGKAADTAPRISDHKTVHGVSSLMRLTAPNASLEKNALFARFS